MTHLKSIPLLAFMLFVGAATATGQVPPEPASSVTPLPAPPPLLKPDQTATVDEPAEPAAAEAAAAEAAAEDDDDDDEPVPDWDRPVQDSASAREFIRSLAASHIPAHYENMKQWGQKKRVTTGLKVSLDGLRVDSERRVKEVNDGTWKRYRIDRKPGEDSLQLVVERVEQRDDGTLHVDLACRAKLLVSGRVAQWERGVQLMSLGMEGDADVRLAAGCDIKVDLNPLRLPPDVIVRPTVTHAKLELLDFRMRRLGALDGPVARQLGEGLEEVLQDQIAHQNRNLAAKLNRQLNKKPDRLKFSFQDWASRKWESFVPKAAPAAATPP